jgi:hypothetical protein
VTPGPGSYNTEGNNKIGTGVPKYSWGTALAKTTLNKTINLSSWVPGPGQYSLSSLEKVSTKNQSPSYHLGKSTKDINYDNKIPGPGQYTINKQGFAKETTWGGMGKEPKGAKLFLSHSFYTPGPAKYNIDGTIGKGPKVFIIF